MYCVAGSGWNPAGGGLKTTLALAFTCLLITSGEGTCGNGILEDQEECDCGSVATCRDPCCRALVCTLKEGAECSNLEPCCRNCKFKRKWELCRTAENECDLPEYCTGQSSSCPPNIFHRDGRNCSEDQGYCSKGYCHTHEDQCRIIFKSHPVASAPLQCYVQLNGIGNERGHCGDLRACSTEDALCGTLQCIDVRREVSASVAAAAAGLTFHSTPSAWAGGTEGSGTNVECQPIGSTAPLVQDRTKCADGKICQKQRCVNVSSVFSIRAKCPGYREGSDVECSGNGFCTSRLTCLCHQGWTGRDCSEAELISEPNGISTTFSTAIVHDIPVTRSEPQGVVTHKHTEDEDDTNYTLGMIFAIAVVTVSITFFMCALIYCYLFSSPISKAKESLDSQADEYSLDTNNGVHSLSGQVTSATSGKEGGGTLTPLQQLEVKVDIPAKNGQLANNPGASPNNKEEMKKGSEVEVDTKAGAARATGGDDDADKGGSELVTIATSSSGVEAEPEDTISVVTEAKS